MQNVHSKAVLGVVWTMDLLTPVCSSASILPRLCAWPSLALQCADGLGPWLWPSRWFWSGEECLILGYTFTLVQGHRHPAANTGEARGVGMVCGHCPQGEGHSVGITGHPPPCSIQLSRALWQR